MKNFLFEDQESGERFFVQCDNELECEEILLANEIDPDEFVLLDVGDDAVAEAMGYDTYSEGYCPSFLLSRPLTTVAGEISIISHPADFVNRQIAQKFPPAVSHNCATLPVDFWCGLCYTNDVKGKASRQVCESFLGYNTTNTKVSQPPR